MSSALQERKKRQSGQAMTEYVIILANCLLVVMACLVIFLDNIGDFYQNVISVVSLPFP